ncbi:MAG: ankyrin repeat domain-containing protein [Kiritimatiellia bacterium]
MIDIDTLIKTIQAENFPAFQAIVSGFLASLPSGDVNTAISEDGQTLMHMAAHGKDPRFVSYLAKLGADPNLMDTPGFPPLVYACMMKNLETMRALLQLGANPERKLPDHSYLLELVVINKNEDVIRLLCQYGANPNRKLKSGATPLILAIRTGSIPILRVLLSFGARLDIPVQGHYPTEYAIFFHNPEMLSALLEAGAAVNQSCRDLQSNYSGNLYLIAMAENQLGCLSVLNACGCDPFYAVDPNVFGPWHFIGDNVEVFRLLLENPHFKKRPLGDVVFFSRDIKNPADRLSLIRTAIKNGMPRFEEENITALLKTAGFITPAILKLLVRSGDSVHTIGPCGSTPIFFALAQNNAPVVKTLVAMGADVNARLSENIAVPQVLAKGKTDTIFLPAHSTPLHLAMRIGNPSLIRLLIEKGADVAALDGDNRSILHYAAPLLLHPDNFAVLLSATKGALDPNLRDADGQTPFMRFAKTADFTDIAAIRKSFLHFIQAGADPNLLDENGETLLMHAFRAGDKHAFQNLLDAVTGFVDLNAANSSGSTLLHLLCAKTDCDQDIAFAFLHPNADFLKESPAPQIAALPPDPNRKNRNGLTAYELAAQNQNPKSFLFSALFPPRP